MRLYNYQSQHLHMTMLTIFTRAAAVHSSRLHALHAFKPKRDPTADPYDTGSGHSRQELEQEVRNAALMSSHLKGSRELTCEGWAHAWISRVRQRGSGKSEMVGRDGGVASWWRGGGMGVPSDELVVDKRC